MPTGKPSERAMVTRVLLSADRRWCIDLYWRKYRGRDECVGFTLRSSELNSLVEAWPDDPDPLVWRGNRRRPPGKVQPVTTGLVRGLNIASVIDRARPHMLRQLAREVDPGGELYGDPDVVDRIRQLRQTAAKRFTDKAAREEKRRDRGRYTLSHYEEVKRIYERTLAEQGQRGAPTKSVAKHFGVPYTTANKWVTRARALFPGMERSQPGRPRKGEEQ